MLLEISEDENEDDDLDDEWDDGPLLECEEEEL
jgi:hypothetical protein